MPINKGWNDRMQCSLTGDLKRFDAAIAVKS